MDKTLGQVPSLQRDSALHCVGNQFVRHKLFVFWFRIQAINLINYTLSDLQNGDTDSLSQIRNGTLN
jgi:hypothetical protein